MVLSAAALIGVAIAVFVRVWWHLKGRKTQLPAPVDAQENSPRGLQ